MITTRTAREHSAFMDSRIIDAIRAENEMGVVWVHIDAICELCPWARNSIRQRLMVLAKEGRIERSGGGGRGKYWRLTT